jgi:hypothetical protein
MSPVRLLYPQEQTLWARLGNTSFQPVADIRDAGVLTARLAAHGQIC